MFSKGKKMGRMALFYILANFLKVWLNRRQLDWPTAFAFLYEYSVNSTISKLSGKHKDYARGQEET